MIQELLQHVLELDAMKRYPQTLFFQGNIQLLQKRKISIVGSRTPNSYTKFWTTKLASELSKRDICLVSGAAMGVDSLVHRAATAQNTIAVMANGLDIRYPSLNTSLIKEIEEQGLCLSQYPAGEIAKSWSFVARNEIVVALGECLIVTQADENSGSMRSVEFALKMGKKIYVLPHRFGESEGTNQLLNKGLATCIYNLDMFLSLFGNPFEKEEDALLEFCKQHSNLNEILAQFGSKLYEYELDGLIQIKDNQVIVL